MRNLRLQVWVAGALVAAALGVRAQPGQISVRVDRPGHRISPMLWGIFFEDINHSADGGIYPELVRNRSFEDSSEPEHWRFACPKGSGSTAAIDESRPLNPFNRHSLRIRVDGEFSLENEGYWGMNFVAGEAYTFKAAARALDGFTGPLTVKLLSGSGQELATGKVSGLGGDWNYYTLELTATGTAAKGKLELSASGRGVLCLDMVSLLPKRTWKGHGLRVDLAESLNGLQPSFMRFPGGCWVEGDTMDKMYHWKNTVGDIDIRTPLWNIWGYYATHGLGFHEYLLLCEDLGAEPLFCINAGMSHKEVVPLDRMGQWVQDALDAIEYANGPASSVWGARRAAAGHPAPFKLKYMEVGNENGGAAYAQRWPMFVKAIKDKYPEMQLVANHWQGGYPKSPEPDVVDEHYYESPEAFMKRASQYDSYERRGPKVFVGEYAVTRNCGQGNLRAAIGEAAFMTGLERNSDVVLMASYAPLFVNLNHRAWNPDLINFDSAHWYGLPSYYVQQMFSQNRGDLTLPVEVHSPLAQNIPSLYACASQEERTGEVIVKVVNTGVGSLDTQLNFVGASTLTGQGTALVLTSASGTDENSLEAPTKVSPHTAPVAFTGTSLTRAFPGNSLTVLRLKTAK